MQASTNQIGTTCLNLSTLKLTPPDIGKVIWRIFAISRLLWVNRQTSLACLVYLPTMSPPARVSPVRGMNTTNGATMQWAGAGQVAAAGTFPRHPPASEKLFMKPIPSHRIQSCEDWVDIISFIFFSFAARARGPPSPCLHLSVSLSIRSHFLPTLPQFSQFYSHSSLHNHVCLYTFSNAFSDPVKMDAPI